jgi:glycosyltransferase involved in cell wall biosynthesis
VGTPLTFVIPTLDEEEAIGPTLDTVPDDELEARDYEVEVLVVDGDSEDRTRERAREGGARVVVEPRPGYGRAYKTGFAEAEGEVLVTGDADATYPFERTPALVERLEQGTDFVTTNRFAEMEEGAMGAKHRFGNWILTTGCRVLFGTGFRDSQSGMWVFRREVLDRITVTDDGMPFSEEIKIEAFRHPDVEAVEVGIPYRERIGDVKLDSWGDGLENLAFLFKKRLGFTDAPEGG